jgi:hypothetical protein
MTALLAFVASSTAAAAASPSTVSPSISATAQEPNAWMMLSVLGPSRAVALGGAAAAAQPGDIPPPRPPVAAGAMADGAGEIIPFVLWFALIALALTISNSSGAPNSPS